MASTAAVPSVDIAICGAGPVGLSATALAVSQGLRVVVIEQHNLTNDESKAISIGAESLRVFHHTRIVDEVLFVVVPGTSTRDYGRDSRRFFHASGPRPFRLGYPFKNPYAQPDLESSHAGTLHPPPTVELRFATRVVGVDQNLKGVIVQAAYGAEAQRVQPKHVVGCDAARSTVQTLHGITMSGSSPERVWLVIDRVAGKRTVRHAAR